MIELNDVSFRYDGSDGDNLLDLSLKIKSGECVVLTGKSGCGKTTITRLLNGLIPSFYGGNLSGSITISGKDITGWEPHMLSQMVGSVFQNPRTQFFCTDTDSELVFGMENCGVGYDEMHRRYDSTVNSLGLENLCGRDIFALSGGEKQRIAFGSIYALSPSIYVLDEPSANLDSAMVKKLKNTLITLKNLGKTILIAEHRLYYLKDIADRIILMKDGRIANEWNSRELSSMPPDSISKLGLRSLYECNPPISTNMMPCEKSALEIQNLSAAYKETGTVFEDLSLSACEGEIVGIVGDNGFGKSTLARTICGLHREKGGKILFDGKEVKHKNRCTASHLVMQDPNYQLFCESVEAELEFSTKGVEQGETDVSELLQTLDLAAVTGSHPLALSGGQKQRICIAVAALSKAKILIFDEPTSGLDYENMQSVASIMKTLASKGKTILVITHDREFIQAACTRTIIFKKNKPNFESEE